MVEPKSPDDLRNWKAIDIYLFDNGKAHSPPRKYHLVADQLDQWLVTLNDLANAHYGLINDQTIDLYTLDGQKIKTPLELTNETAYVAVKPSETYIEAEYEKYLIRASKSREKRQSLREHSNSIANTENSRTPEALSDTAQIQKETSEAKFIHANSIQTPEESYLIQTILANKTAKKTNVVVKSTGNDKRTSQNNIQILPAIKSSRDKRSFQQSGNKNPVSLSQPQPVKKPSFKRRESIRLSDAKIIPPPDINKKNTSSRNELSTEGNLPNKSRIYKSISNRKNSTEPGLSKVAEVINELKKYSNDNERISKNVISLNENDIITIIDNRNADSDIQRKSSAIFIDVTTLKQFKDDLSVEKSKETPKTNRDLSNKIENDIVNATKDILQTTKEQIECPEIAIGTSVNNPTSKIENKSQQENIQVKREKTKGREIVTNTHDNNTSNVADKVNIKPANRVDIKVQKDLIVPDEYTENSPNRVGIPSATDKSGKIQDNLSQPNNPNTNNKPMNAVLTSENKVRDNHSKPGSVKSFRKSDNNYSGEAHKTDFTSKNDKNLNIEKEPLNITSQNTANKTGEDFLNTANKTQDFNPEPTSEITIENFMNIDDINNVSSAVYRGEAESLKGNYLSTRASTLALASEITTNFVDKASNTDEVKMLSVNDKTENVQDNPSKSANEGSERLVKKLSTSVGKEDVVNLKLSIDIWNHNSDPCTSRPTVASMSHTPYITKRYESQDNIPNQSNLKGRPSDNQISANVKDDQKIIVIKYVPHHPKDEQQYSDKSPKCINKDFIIILPIVHLDHIIAECSRAQEPNNYEDSEKNHKGRISSIKFPIKKATSCTSLLKVLSPFEIRSDAPVNQSKELSPNKTTNPSREPSSLTRDKASENRESISKRKSVAINEELTNNDSVCYRISAASESMNNRQLIIIDEKKSETMEKPCDKAVQTEWCNLMMEARVQDDGHYALFLPSIEKLKQYKLHC